MGLAIPASRFCLMWMFPFSCMSSAPCILQVRHLSKSFPGVRARDELDERNLIALMVGQNQELREHSSTSQTGGIRLSVCGLNRKSCFHNVNFDLRSGEVLGIAGLMGSGRTDCLRPSLDWPRPIAARFSSTARRFPSRARARHSLKGLRSQVKTGRDKVWR